MTPSRTARRALAAAVLPIASLSACSGGAKSPSPSPAAGTPGAVSIRGFRFSPDPLRVVSGTVVTWTNADDTAHSVVASDGAFKSPDRLVHGASYTVTLSTKGTFTYHCGIHNFMTATVVVT